jgi:hypothetical protein
VAADWRLLVVLYLITSPNSQDVWRVHSNTPHSKGMTADRGGWVIGAFGKSSMPYFCPKLLRRTRYLTIHCNVNESQPCAISMMRIRSSIKICISPGVQVSPRPGTALPIHASQMKENES